MTKVKFIYAGYLNIEGTDNSMDTIEAAIESVREGYGNQVADFAEFTIEGEEVLCGDHLVPLSSGCGCLL
jgi:hypothetical protein